MVQGETRTGKGKRNVGQRTARGVKAVGGAFAFGETRPGEISSSRPLRPPYASVALLSAAALAYEILLTRLFAIVQWHHFAYMMISAALLRVADS